MQEKATDDPVKFLIADRAFHIAIYQSCGNALLSDLAATLYSYQLNDRRRAIGKPGAIAQSISDHRRILAALIARDAQALAEALAREVTSIVLVLVLFTVPVALPKAASMYCPTP